MTDPEHSERREFLEVVAAEVAKGRFRQAVRCEPVGTESVSLAEAHGRVLAEDVLAPVDVPGFDRANVDGFAIRAVDSFGADEAHPRTLTLTGEVLHPGTAPNERVEPGHATEVATGGVLPRGADAVIMIEHVGVDTGSIDVRRALVPGANLAFAGSDITHGELVLPAGTRLTARETGTLAAVGCDPVPVFRRPRIAVLSTGDEIVDPAGPIALGEVYDSNLRIVSDTLRELGCEPVSLGVVRDDIEALRTRVKEGLGYDGLVLSGGTSKGGGDYSARVVGEFASIVAHGVAVKPGKPLCLASFEEKPVVVLPGFPTSAVFTFHEFVAPILSELTGVGGGRTSRTVHARLPHRVELDPGRAEFVLVHLVERGDGVTVAYPMAKGSGSVTTFARADGFITLDRNEEFLEAESEVEVHRIGRDIEPVDLVVIGSHCVGLDRILARVRERGFSVKIITVGSQGGLTAAARGECDLAGVHLCDENGVYNRPFLRGDVTLIEGYGRSQGIVTRPGESPDLGSTRMVHRNRGSGTRILIDTLLAERGLEGDRRPDGFAFQAKSHHTVAAAVAQGRADWGVAIESVAKAHGLAFEPLADEQYDFVIPKNRTDRPAVRAFLEVLADAETGKELRELGFTPTGA